VLVRNLFAGDTERRISEEIDAVGSDVELEMVRQTVGPLYNKPPNVHQQRRVEALRVNIGQGGKGVFVFVIV
jgi:hypothetical protein